MIFAAVAELVTIPAPAIGNGIVVVGGVSGVPGVPSINLALQVVRAAGRDEVMMDAPLYPPAMAYVQPVRVVQPLSARETPISDLMRNPAAWAIVTKEIPGLDQIAKGDQIRPHLGNFSLESLRPFGLGDKPTLDRIDRQFQSMGTIR